MKSVRQDIIAIIGQGYVGLPLAIAFAEYFRVIGYDIDCDRIQDLKRIVDKTHQADLSLLAKYIRNDATELLKSQNGYFPSCNIQAIESAKIFIITVPTPVDQFYNPDLSFLMKATHDVAGKLKTGNIVIYESTVYPGCTEEECVPLLEQISELVYNKDFFVGYSPERVNPGDQVNTLTKIKKVTSGSTSEIAKKIDELYRTIITAGTHLAPSIKVAEASKAIENAQRDINVSFINELALIFDRLGIDTQDVLDAAGTKFNFHKYKPGLVGGHCISVDPYYLVHKATQVGYHPQVILSGRRINEMMAEFIAGKVVKLMTKKNIPAKDAEALILGVTFKENCPDTRNTKVVEIAHELEQFGLKVDILDPLANSADIAREHGVIISNKLGKGKKYQVIILAVAHDVFLTLDINSFKAENAVIFDVKSVLPRHLVDARL